MWHWENSEVECRGVERASRWLEQVRLESGVKSADLMGLVASGSEPESSAGNATTSIESRTQTEKLAVGEAAAAFLCKCQTRQVASG